MSSEAARPAAPPARSVRHATTPATAPCVEPPDNETTRPSDAPSDSPVSTPVATAQPHRQDPPRRHRRTMVTKLIYRPRTRTRTGRRSDRYRTTGRESPEEGLYCGLCTSRSIAAVRRPDTVRRPRREPASEGVSGPSRAIREVTNHPPGVSRPSTEPTAGDALYLPRRQLQSDSYTISDMK